MNVYLAVILFAIVGNYLLCVVVETLDLRHLKTQLPQEYIGYYDAAAYGRAQNYLRENIKFELLTDTLVLPILIGFILLGGFNVIDRVARNFQLGAIPTGLLFAAILLLVFQVISLPLAAYKTFVIEERYGFNRTSVRTFVIDILKSWMVVAVVGGSVFSIVLWFFARAGNWAWVWCWMVVALFQVMFTFFAPVVILPLFNKLNPLEDGELKSAIERYARSQSFTIKGVFKMDASRRSTKSNAFFIGFGKFRRIVLFDTLIEKHTTDELVSILAHEMGHYKKKHILKFTMISILVVGGILYLCSRFLNNEGLFSAFRMRHTSIYASLVFFAFLYEPINTVMSIFTNRLSRKYEYEADAYAVRTHGKPECMISALKKLAVDNLSNLTPHPLKVLLRYRHPPVLERIKAIRSHFKTSSIAGLRLL